MPRRLDASLLCGDQAGAPDTLSEGQPTAITYTGELDEGKTFAISPEVETVLGYSLAEWMADPLLRVKLRHPDDRERVVETCNAANAKKEPFHADYRMIARDGRIISIRDQATIVYGALGEPLCWQGVMVVVPCSPDRDQA